MLWPLALLDVVEQHNVFKFDAYRKISLKKLSGVQCGVGINHFHTRGCPVYVLDSRLHDGYGKMPKFDPRSRAGIHLDKSTVHDHSVVLVLNPNTSHVSPQFHYVFDDQFTTVSHMTNGMVTSNWADLVVHIYKTILTDRFPVYNTWITQNQPPNHIPNFQKYLDRQRLDDPSTDESTGEHSGRSEGAPTHKVLVREMPHFEGTYLDVVQPDKAHNGDGTTFISTASTNKPN